MADSKKAASEQPNKQSFTQKHGELWKFIKFAFASGGSTVIELIIFYILQNVVFVSLNTTPVHFWIFDFEGIGYMWSYLISTTIGYLLAFIFNRKITFKADANPALSMVLYVIMVVFTICVTTVLGPWITTLFIENGMKTLGEIVTKPIVALIPTIWTYPLNRFVIHRKKKPEAEN